MNRIFNWNIWLSILEFVIKTSLKPLSCIKKKDMMSILKYITPYKTSIGQKENTILLSCESPGISIKEYKNIVETVKPAEKVKRSTYKDEDKMKVTKFDNIYGAANAVRIYSKEFPIIKESAVRG